MVNCTILQKDVYRLLVPGHLVVGVHLPVNDGFHFWGNHSWVPGSRPSTNGAKQPILSDKLPNPNDAHLPPSSCIVVAIEVEGTAGVCCSRRKSSASCSCCTPWSLQLQNCKPMYISPYLPYHASELHHSKPNLTMPGTALVHEVILIVWYWYAAVL